MRRASTSKESHADPAVTRSKRFGFTIGKDIALLKSTLQHNPSQLGPKKWMEIATEMKDLFKSNVSERTVKERVLHLKKLYETQQLSFKTGTEEEKSERGMLLENIIELYEESVATINEELGANEEMEFSSTEETASNVQKKLRAERKNADEERDKIANDLAPEPQPKRKRSRLMPEDELIKMKMEHDMKLEEERLRLEKDKIEREHEMESKRLDFEMKKFEFEKQREERLSDENKRKDELTRIQMGIQEGLIKFLAKLSEK